MAIRPSLALDSPEHTGYVVLLLEKKQHLKEENLSLCILLLHTSIKNKTTHSSMTLKREGYTEGRAKTYQVHPVMTLYAS